MSSLKDSELLLEQVEQLKKDVYFSYVLKLNHRYIFKDLYTIFERVNYININANQYLKEVGELYKKIDVDNVELTREDMDDIEQVKRTKDISLKELEFFIKNTDSFFPKKETSNYKFLKYLKFGMLGVMAIVVGAEVVL